jgi:magnesium transporter
VTDVLYGLATAERQRIAALREQRRFFWLDVSLGETSQDDVVDALRIPERAARALGGSAGAVSSRTVEADAEAVVFALRCYVELETPADEAAYRLRPLEVRVVITGDYVLTLHQEQVALPAALMPDLPEERGKAYAGYAVLQAMVASTFDALEEVELRLDGLTAAATGGGGGRLPRATVRAAAARLAAMRRWVTAEQAVFGRIATDIEALRGFDADDEPYFDRLDEQVTGLVASIDAAANGMGMLLDLQLNERAYLLSVVATIFVPLTFITGFFGMNFGWMIDQIDTPLTFWVLGFILPIAVPVLSWRFVVRRLLMGDSGEPSSG